MEKYLNVNLSPQERAMGLSINDNDGTSTDA